MMTTRALHVFVILQSSHGMDDDVLVCKCEGKGSESRKEGGHP